MTGGGTGQAAVSREHGPALALPAQPATHDPTRRTDRTAALRQAVARPLHTRQNRLTFAPPAC